MNVKCGFRPLWTAGTERLQSDSKVAGYIISVWGFKEGMLLCSSCSHLHQGSARNRRIPWLWLQLCDGSALSKETTTHSLSLPLSFSRRLLFSYSIIRIGKAKGERERGLFHVQLATAQSFLSSSGQSKFACQFHGQVHGFLSSRLLVVKTL